MIWLCVAAHLFVGCILALAVQVRDHLIDPGESDGLDHLMLVAIVVVWPVFLIIVPLMAVTRWLARRFDRLAAHIADRIRQRREGEGR